MSLHENEALMIVDAWAAIKPHVNKKERDDAAQALLRTLENYIDVEGMASEIVGHDGPLDRALSALYDGITEDDDYNDPEGDEELFSSYDDDE